MGGRYARTGRYRVRLRRPGQTMAGLLQVPATMIARSLLPEFLQKHQYRLYNGCRKPSPEGTKAACGAVARKNLLS